MKIGRGGYSRFISITKVVLPLVAIGLLSTVFLFTKDNTLESGFRFSDADLDALESGLQVVKPRLFGSNPSGDVYNFAADSLAPDSLSPSLIAVERISGEIQYQTGTNLQMTAAKAEFMLEGQSIRLSGGMSLVTSSSIRVTGDGLLAELSSGEIESNGPVSATSPMGSIQAGNLRVVNIDEDGEENQMIWFENGVMLSFKPDSWKVEEAESE